MRSSKHVPVRISRTGGNYELKIDGQFVASWGVPHDMPDKAVPQRTADNIADAAYQEGYNAARKDFKRWLEGYNA